jgi:glycosyltransferase involved in cell wall biosynthesis
MNEAVTLVVIPRERFSMACESLDSLLASVDPTVPVIYIDGHAPAEIRAELEHRASGRPVQFISVPHYLSNNQARNRGFAQVRTPWVCFVDNDLIFAPGWLDALSLCAEETGTDVVAPLICEGSPAHTILHYAGGEYTAPGGLAAFHADRSGRRALLEQQLLLKQPLDRWRSELRRGPTGFCEPHCFLARTALLRRLGNPPFDEAMMATKEHLDFCMSVREAGGSIYFEPGAMITFMLPNPDRPLTRRDLPFYLLRWSDAWQHRSLDHFRRKWGLGGTDFRRRYLGSGYRREALIERALGRVPLLPQLPPLAHFTLRVVRRIEKWINRAYVHLYEKHCRRRMLAAP